MADIAELLARVEAATGPDRGLDAELDAALRIGVPKMEAWAWVNFDTWRPAPPPGSGMVEVVHSNGSGGLIWQSQPFTASIDAAVALVEKVLPGWHWGLSTEPRVHGITYHAAISNLGFEHENRESMTIEDASYMPTPALAMIAALLRALAASPVHPQGS